ncbi:hypothetical protein ATK36_3336 [Amycolatopsis sulphurea]|uniref:Uncharacterized protein n=1 Tax=Amycolatopsis sulphurea TaxID=76022 RepID=A0A2A9FA00_9PSEU|nr:hypothetical protein [Amycolatopsis sulphurea]PFG48257.1 hypothetical protein ATK36_3336 [Amycolatopsis sulphurea]
MTPHEQSGTQQGREAFRSRLENHFHQAWGVPASAIFFRTQRFRLDYPGRSDLGALGLAGKIAWTLCLPFFAVYVLVGSILSEVGINLPALEDKETVKPGTVRVLGMVKAESVTSLIDALRRGRRGGWLVLAQGRAAFVKGSAPTAVNQPTWACTDGSVTLSVNTDHHNEIHLAWRQVARASLYLDPAEGAIALRQSRNFA